MASSCPIILAGAIFYAITQDRDDVVLLLLQNGATTHIVNNKGQSVVSLAASHLQQDTVNLLQERDAEEDTPWRNFRASHSDGFDYGDLDPRFIGEPFATLLLPTGVPGPMPDQLAVRQTSLLTRKGKFRRDNFVTWENPALQDAVDLHASTVLNEDPVHPLLNAFLADDALYLSSAPESSPELLLSISFSQPVRLSRIGLVQANRDTAPCSATLFVNSPALDFVDLEAGLAAADTTISLSLKGTKRNPCPRDSVALLGTSFALVNSLQIHLVASADSVRCSLRHLLLWGDVLPRQGAPRPRGKCTSAKGGHQIPDDDYRILYTTLWGEYLDVINNHMDTSLDRCQSAWVSLIDAVIAHAKIQRVAPKWILLLDHGERVLSQLASNFDSKQILRRMAEDWCSAYNLYRSGERTAQVARKWMVELFGKCLKSFGHNVSMETIISWCSVDEEFTILVLSNFDELPAVLSQHAVALLGRLVRRGDTERAEIEIKNRRGFGDYIQARCKLAMRFDNASVALLPQNLHVIIDPAPLLKDLRCFGLVPVWRTALLETFNEWALTHGSGSGSTEKTIQIARKLVKEWGCSLQSFPALMTAAKGSGPASTDDMGDVEGLHRAELPPGLTTIYVAEPREVAIFCKAAANMPKIVGIDCEWSQCRPISLAQVAFGDYCFLIDFVGAASVHQQRAHAALLALLAHSDVRVIGFAFSGDWNRLQRALAGISMSGTSFPQLSNLVDLQRHASGSGKFVMPSGHARGQKPSLLRCVAVNLGLHLSKKEQRSDWDARPLSTAQEKYAALDAVVLLQLYDAAKRLGIDPSVWDDSRL